MDSIAQWLNALGLDQYAAAFAESDIDLPVLRDLSDADLRDLGVTLGHRRKLLRAIAELPLHPAPTRPSAPRPETAARQIRTETAGGGKDAERRQLTVLFCDLVGSTALSARLDPEDLREVFAEYHRCCAKTIRDAGGFVAKYMGDGVLAYFGYPHAHEDDAERAVRAGLALTEGVCRLEASPNMQVRVGIATGLVVVGDLIGEGAAAEQAVIGQTPNLAARLQTLAEPGQVVIAARTRRLLGGLFEYHDGQPMALKGFAEPVVAWQVLRPSTVVSRFEARQEGKPAPLVGRDEELDMLLRRWRQARAGEGRVVLLLSDPGVGKSRIARALEDRLTGEPHVRLRYYCSPHHQESALFPTIAQLAADAGFLREDLPDLRLAKLQSLLARSGATEEEVALLADLLSLPAGGRDRLPELSPQRRKEKTLEALLAQTERLSAQKPVLIVYEDVHWIDPTSLDLLSLAVERWTRLPVFLVITARPEFTAPWPGRPHLTTMRLARLDRAAAAALVRRVAQAKPLPDEVLEQILARTDGVPLFLEELTKTVLESGLVRERAGRFVLNAPLPPLAIPTTLHASLMARLDRLAGVREIAQIGAAIGREFSHELLRALVPMSQAALDDALERLVASDLVFRRGSPPDATYTFKHALVRDAAYDAMLRRRRQELHGRIVDVLEKQFADVVEQQPELLAQHCGEAGLLAKAIHYWGVAGRKSVARSAMVEAVSQLRRGLDLLASLPEGRERLRHELQLRIALGEALYASSGPAAADTGEAYARARDLCHELGDTAALVQVLSGLSSYHMARSELTAVRGIGEELLGHFEGQSGAVGRLIAKRILGGCLFWMGEFAASRKNLEGILNPDIAPVGHSIEQVALYDTRTVGLIYLSSSLLIQGYPDAALARSRESISLGREVRHPQTMAFALSVATRLYLLCRDEQAALEALNEVISLAQEQRFPFWLAVGNILYGYALSSSGRVAEGLALVRKAYAEHAALGSMVNHTYYLALIAQCHARAGEPEAALGLLNFAADGARKTGERWYEAELHRLKGEWVLANRPDGAAAAETCFRHALAVARQQDARWWELRAAASLAGLWREQGRRREARELLRPICGWFTEGFALPDLEGARALLDAVA